MLKYFRRAVGEEDWVEINYGKALNALLTTYKDNDMTRDMLTIPNYIECRFSTISVKDYQEDGTIRELKPGLYNNVPLWADYDENGFRRINA